MYNSKRIESAVLMRMSNIKIAIRKSLGIVLSSLLLCAFSQNVSAATIKNIRVGNAADGFRMVLDADSKFAYKAFLLKDPKRLVVDVYDSTLSSTVEKFSDSKGLVSHVRIGNPESNAKRVAFDLKTPVKIKKVFMLAPQSGFGWRFVVDVVKTSEKDFDAHIGSKYAFDSRQGSDKKVGENKNKVAAQAVSKAKKIIVLDPGHGGKDPGAIGFSGVYEKNITLKMAKELKAMLDKEGKYVVYLTRSTDIFIPLRDRVKIARKYNADLFMSIHADSAVNRNAKGLSVYTLSERASDKEAEALAERENKADVVAGLNLYEHSKEVSDILINLAQRETMNRSSEFAGFMVQEMKKSVKLVDNTHRFAGFAVLKAPDVPSVLLEMGYLSNRTEESQLKQASYRKKLATSTSKAIKKYFDNMQHASVF